MSESFPGGEVEHQQAMGDGVTSAGGVCLPFYHVPQQCRREKLRYPNSHDSPPFNSQASTSSSPSFFHYHPHGNPSFAFPCSSSYQLFNEYGGVPSFNLLEHHAFYEGAAQSQAIHGVSLSLSSSVVSPSHHSQQEHLIGAGSMCGVSARMEPVPAGPFTGYATILKVSRFLRPTQQMLEEVCGGASAGGLAGGLDDIETLDFTADCLGAAERNLDETMSGEQRRMKTRLVSLLEEVCRRYRLYFQQIQAVITSFEAVAGLNMAAPYTPLAVKTLTRHFKCLKDAIVYQLRFVNESGRDGMNKDEISGHNRYLSGGFGFQRAASGSAPINQQPAWRPQRGLPERAVAVLRSWLFEHFLHPYPTDMDKQMLAKQTGLSRSQVSNWFINARVRLWKPMVEEIHSLEQRRRVSSESDDKPADPSSSSFPSPASEQTQNKHGGSSRKNQEQRFQSELAEIAGRQVAAPVGYNVDVQMAGVVAGGHAGVSLTLGLHQNNAYCLPEQIPLNVARRFGLEDGYVMGGFEGKEFDGQLLRDGHFVA